MAKTQGVERFTVVRRKHMTFYLFFHFLITSLGLVWAFLAFGPLGPHQENGYQLGLSKDPSKPTHPLPLIEPDPPPTEPTAPAVGDGFHSPKSEINGSEIGSPPLKSEKPDPTYPSFFRRVLRFFWVDPTSFEFSLERFKLDLARFHQIQPRSC